MTGILCWMFAVAAGVRGVWAYSARAGDAAQAPTDWPRETNLSRDSARPTLVLFIHPHCPCSRASLAELDRLMARCGDRLSVQLVFVKPAGAPLDWEQTDLWKQAGNAGGVARIIDENAAEAIRFGAATSGQALLYSIQGSLLFRGGITGARGEEGDNAGSNSIVDLVRDQSGLGQAPVFGCPLIGSRQLQTSEPECTR